MGYCQILFFTPQLPVVLLVSCRWSPSGWCVFSAASDICSFYPTATSGLAALLPLIAKWLVCVFRSKWYMLFLPHSYQWSCRSPAVDRQVAGVCFPQQVIYALFTPQLPVVLPLSCRWSPSGWCVFSAASDICSFYPTATSGLSDLLPLIAKWLVCVFRSLDEFTDNSEFLEQLSKLQIMPLSCGKLASVKDATIFFPIIQDKENMSQGM